jgi:probable F420-dependent oxidoreductase
VDTTSPAHPFGRLGAWVLRYLPESTLTAVAHEVEAAGYDTLWVSGGVDPGAFDVIERLLDVTDRITVAAGVVNLWAETPESVTSAWHRCEERYPGRLYIGLGISHAPLVEGRLADKYATPMAKMVGFLDGLDSQVDPLPPHRRFLGALGPKMLALAADRTLGTHLYLVSTQSTAMSRRHIPGSLVAPELGVVLDHDRAAARAVARSELELYLGLPNYTNNWLRSGFTEADLGGGGSDALVDSLFAVGDVSDVAARVAEHRDAGADHVALQVVGNASDHVGTFRALAGI